MTTSHAQSARLSNSPSSDELTAYCNRGLEALESLAEAFNDRQTASGSETTAHRQFGLAAHSSPPHATDRSCEETEVGVHYRQPAALAAGLYADTSSGATPSPLRRPRVCDTNAGMKTAPVTDPVVVTTTATTAPPRPLPSGLDGRRSKVPPSRLWYYAPASETPDTSHPTPQHAVTQAVVVPAPVSTSTPAAPRPIGTTSVRDFYQTRNTTTTATTSAPQASARRGSGALHRDAVLLAADAPAVLTTSPQARIQPASTSQPVPEAAQKAPSSVAVPRAGAAPVPSSSSSSSRPSGTRAVQPHRGRPHARKPSETTKARTRSAPGAVDRVATGNAGTAAPAPTRTRSSPVHSGRRPYQRSRSSSNEDPNDVKKPVRAAPPPTSQAPHETLCVRTTTTGTSHTEGGAKRHTTDRAEPSNQIPTSYPRAARAVQCKPESRADPRGAARARSEPPAANAATTTARASHSPPPSRPTPAPRQAPQARAPLPVPLGPPAWVAFPRHTVRTGADANPPHHGPTRGPVVAYPLHIAALPTTTTSTPAAPNYYTHFHQPQIDAAGAVDPRAWGRPAPMVVPARLRHLPEPTPTTAPGDAQARRGVGTRTPANTRRPRQPSPQSEMRFSYSEVYHPLGLLADGSPGGGGLRTSLETLHVAHDALDRLDSGRLLLSKPPSRASSGGARLSPTPHAAEAGPFHSPWLTAPSAIRPVDGGKSAAPSGLSTLARLVEKGHTNTNEPATADDEGSPRRKNGAEDCTAVFPVDAPVSAAGRGRPLLAPLPRALPPPMAKLTGPVPVHRALDFDGRLTAAASPTNGLAARDPRRLEPLRQPPSPVPAVVSSTPSPSPAKPPSAEVGGSGRGASTPAWVASAAVVRVNVAGTEGLGGGGIIAEHIPPALPTSPGGGSSRSHGSAVLPGAPATPSSGSSARPMQYVFTASPSAPATAGQPVGALTTASVGPSSTTTSSRHSGQPVKEEDAVLTSLRDGEKPSPPRVGPNAILHASPRRPLPPHTTNDSNANNNNNNAARTNYYGAFHTARLRPAPAVVPSARANSPLPVNPEIRATPTAPAMAPPVPPAPAGAEGQAPVPAPAGAVPRSPRQPIEAAHDGPLSRLPAPRPRLGIPHDIVLPGDPTPAPEQGNNAHRDGGVGPRLRFKLFKRRATTRDSQKAASGQGTAKTYKAVHRSRSGEAVPASSDADAWETLPDEMPADDQNTSRPRAARSLFPSSVRRTAANGAGDGEGSGRPAARQPLHSTTLSPVKKSWKRVLPWMR